MRDARTQHLPQDDADGQAARGYPSGVDASLARYRGSATPGYSWGTALRFGKMEQPQSTGLRHRNLHPKCGIEVHERHEKHERPDGCGSCCAHPPGAAEKFRKAFVSCRFVLFVDTPSPLLGSFLPPVVLRVGVSGAG